MSETLTDHDYDALLIGLKAMGYTEAAALARVEKLHRALAPKEGSEERAGALETSRISRTLARWNGENGDELMQELQQVIRSVRLLGRDDEILREVLRDHWITAVQCDEAAQTDVVVCYCAKWRSEPMRSVGLAVERWVEHVMEKVREARHAS